MAKQKEQKGNQATTQTNKEQNTGSQAMRTQSAQGGSQTSQQTGRRQRRQVTNKLRGVSATRAAEGQKNWSKAEELSARPERLHRHAGSLRKGLHRGSRRRGVGPLAIVAPHEFQGIMEAEFTDVLEVGD